MALPEASTAVSPSGALDPGVRRAMIAEAAYFRAEKRGFVAGGEMDDWLAAEADVDALLSL
jgi:hypothetical protein